jgi:hypothetical protein
MAVYREGYIALELIQNNSFQIFPDACDFGAPTRKGDSIWNAAKQLVDWYGEEGTRTENRYSTGRSVEAHVELMDEWAVSDGRKSEREATDRFIVSFVSCQEGRCKGKDGYIYIAKI